MVTLNWLVGKTISGTSVQRTPQHLEMVIGVVQDIREFVIELRGLDVRDWFDTEGMALEAVVGRTVAATEQLERQVTASEKDYTYRVWFADETYIDIFADCRMWDNQRGCDVQIRDQLFFSVRNPHEEDWEESTVVDELDADLERVRQSHAEAEAGELLPQYRYRYLNHF